VLELLEVNLRLGDERRRVIFAAGVSHDGKGGVPQVKDVDVGEDVENGCIVEGEGGHALDEGPFDFFNGDVGGCGGLCDDVVCAPFEQLEGEDAGEGGGGTSLGG
jgi:hypothetical protein